MFRFKGHKKTSVIITKQTKKKTIASPYPHTKLPLQPIIKPKSQTLSRITNNSCKTGAQTNNKLDRIRSKSFNINIP